ncbi:SH3 domain-containing protein [Parvularcula oceani]|uniref:SH3 domain-containing protein n=1 Tax=Parvularcula oceani TaxID=1247963 RepID=UPI003B506206
MTAPSSPARTRSCGQSPPRARPAAPGRARLAPGLVTEIDECEAGWCRLRAGDFRGWLPEDALWGVSRG